MSNEIYLLDMYCPQNPFCTDRRPGTHTGPRYCSPLDIWLKTKKNANMNIKICTYIFNKMNSMLFVSSSDNVIRLFSCICKYM